MTPASATDKLELKVAIVEDDPRFRASLEALLSHTEGLRLAGSFTSPTPLLDEAQRTAAAGEPGPQWDLVLMDLKLPGLSGIEATRRLKRLHPDVRFVSEIGGEDMKTIFFTDAGAGKSKQVFMQSACSGGTGTFIEKTARKLQVAPDRLAAMGYAGLTLHKVSSKCGIFAETDANTLVKTGVPVEETRPRPSEYRRPSSLSSTARISRFRRATAASGLRAGRKTATQEAKS